MIKDHIITNTSKDGTSINNFFQFSDEKDKSLVVIFPGKGYSCEMPLLYYCREAALQLGCDVLSLKYYFQCSDVPYSANDLNDFKQVVTDCFTAIRECLSGYSYKNIVFLSKSIGTLFAGDVKDMLNIINIRHFFLTPLEKTIPCILKENCVAITGSKDIFFTAEHVTAIKDSPNSEICLINDVDHSLEAYGDYLQSLDVLKFVTTKWQEFIAETKGKNFGTDKKRT